MKSQWFTSIITRFIRSCDIIILGQSTKSTATPPDITQIICLFQSRIRMSQTKMWSKNGDTFLKNYHCGHSFQTFLKRPSFTGLHTQKACTDRGTSSPQILLLSAHAYMYFAWKLQLDSQCVHSGVHIHVWLQICMSGQQKDGWICMSRWQRVWRMHWVEEVPVWLYYAFWVCKPVLCTGGGGTGGILAFFFS